MLLRISASVLLLFSILFMPLWVSIFLAFLGMIYFEIYFEATVLFFFSDLLYGVRGVDNTHFIFTSFFASLFILIIIEIIKKQLKFYNK